MAAAGSILAGLCLVVGAVALVAGVTELPSAAPVSGTAHHAQTGSYGGPGTRTGPAAAHGTGTHGTGADATGTNGTGAHGRALRPAAPAAHLAAGHGTGRTRGFAIGGSGTVQLEWSADCALWDRAGGFVVQELTGGAAGSTPAGQPGQRGHRATAAPAGAAVHYLTINSGCAWKMRVLTSG